MIFCSKLFKKRKHFVCLCEEEKSIFKFWEICVSFKREKTEFFVSVIEIVQILAKSQSFHCTLHSLQLEAL